MSEKIRIDKSTCTYCGGCVGVCPEQALFLWDTELKADQDKCTLCRACVIFCPVKAISLAAKSVPLRLPDAPDLRTDVVIVGAGPAGSVCAKFLAQAGADVLVVEKKQEIGVPKRCAEAVDIEAFEAAGVEPHPLWLANRIQAAVLYAPDGNSVRFGTSAAEQTGWIIERKIFEKHLAKDAIVAGARYRMKTMALGVIRENGFARGVLVEHMGLRQRIDAKIVIAADGVDSMIAKSAGLDTVNRLENYISCFQYEMAGLRGVDETAIHLFYGNDIAPGGYLWIFPKGRTMANVGVGIKTSRESPLTPKKRLDRFIESHPALFQGASAVEFNSGGVPVRRTLGALTADGLMIIGDAAQLVEPITGAGIKSAMISGRLAAEAAAEALRRRDVSRGQLGAYEKRWISRQGKKLDRLFKLQRFTENLTDDDFNGLASVLSAQNLEEMARGKLSGFIRVVLKKIPSLAPLALKYLRS